MSIRRILLVGAGGVGTAFARIAARRRFADLVIADYDLGRAARAAEADPDRYAAVQLDARDEQATAPLLTEHRCAVLTKPTHARCVMPLHRAPHLSGSHFAHIAGSLAPPLQYAPYQPTGVQLRHPLHLLV